ncbi:MAG: polyprenyl synthetase family protein [Candidatus Heimdallarchaeota archaeon]|nr:polyprenyl synthetase family protein [Candidatus Heimdallarchaeota archaeon]MBY8994612.1 polyprenyl synthetase family protein [Candidatus Heimdallarchaeota archaeon]
MDIRLVLKSNMDAVHRELEALFNENGMKLIDLGKFGDLFYDEFKDYLTDGGKRIRPFLVKTAFDAVGGNHKEGNITRASLSIELLHNGSLLHDDVIDKDETRRGKPAFHVKFRKLHSEKKKETFEKANDFGEAMSIFAGDLCFPFAIESIIQSGFPAVISNKALQAFTQAFREVIDGVIIETGDTTLHEGSEETYKKMVDLKTGALIRKSVEIGAILGRGTDSQIEALVDYCKGIGTAFQIQDDILGIFGNLKEIGKPVGGDIREDKQTILRILAIKNGTDNQIKRISDLHGKEDLTEDELTEIQGIFKETGAFDEAHKMIKQVTHDAINSLETAEPPLKEKPKKHLIELANYLVNRKK